MKKHAIKLTLATVLAALLCYTLINSVYRMFFIQDSEIERNYPILILQCFLGLAVMPAPYIVEKKTSVSIPDTICILYFVFLFCSIFLGNVVNLYSLIPYWDSVLHGFSGILFGATGLALAQNSSSASISPAAKAFFAFTFALSAGVVWEIYEFCGDILLGINMQGHMSSNGEPLLGQTALFDTMKDIIFDTGGALLAAVAGYVSIRTAKKPCASIPSTPFHQNKT